MKTLLLSMLLCVTFSLSAQFHRSYLNGTSSYGVFSSQVFVNSQQETQLVSVVPGNPGSVRILVQNLNAEGEVLSVAKNDYVVTLPGSVQTMILEGIAESGTERYYLLSVGGTSTSNLLWIKVNKNTLAFIGSHSGTTVFKNGFFKAELIGTEFITYKVKNSGGLYRIAVNTGTFNAETEELVNAAITTGVSLANHNAGIRAGALHKISALEYIVFGTGSSNAAIYRRSAANNYTSYSTGVPCGSGMSSFLVNSTTIGISDGLIAEHYNALGTLTANGTFPATVIASKNYVAYINNTYHLFKKYSFGNSWKHYSVNSSFQLQDSVQGQLTAVYDVAETSNGVFIVALYNDKGLSSDIQGNSTNGKSFYVERLTSEIKLVAEEYSRKFETDQLSANVGIGTKVFMDPNGLPAVNYKSVSSVFNLSEHYLAFTSSDDTICNNESEFSEQVDELPGPYTESNAYDEVTEAKYNRAYYVSVRMIEDHIDSVQSGSQTYIPPFGIKNWPAHGNTAIGQAANLAPFTDADGNGVYEPLEGDYPIIYGDECVFSISHYRTAGNNDKAIEFHSYVYTQNCDTSDVFDNVILRKVKVFSRGADIDSLFYGARFDGDLGNYNDDYMGTNVDLGLVYNYNGDAYDEENAGRKGFHDTIPAQGIMVLKGFKQTNDGLDNAVGSGAGESPNGYGFADGVNDNEYYGLQTSQIYLGMGAPASSDPQSIEDWHNVYNGRFSSGDTVYYGGSGYFPADNDDLILSHYMYTGNEDASHYGTNGIDPGGVWSEFEPTGTASTSNPSGDRRVVFGLGKTNLESGEFLELDYAYLIAGNEAVATSIFESVNVLFEKSQDVRNSFLANEGPCNINFDPIPGNLSIAESASDEHIIVYPNPTWGSVKIAGLVAETASVTIFDLNGRQLKTVDISSTNSEIDLQDLSGNVFILCIKENGKTYMKRVSKF